MKKNTLNYLTALVAVYSVYDYFEHITRPGSVFEEHPFYWLAFTLGVLFSLVLVCYPTKYGLEKLLKRKSLLIELGAVGVWFVSYVTFLGPLVDKLLWPFNELYFSFQSLPFAILMTVYLVARIIINLVMKKKVLYAQ